MLPSGSERRLRSELVSRDSREWVRAPGVQRPVELRASTAPLTVVVKKSSFS
jgi:hypothetical protein